MKSEMENSSESTWVKEGNYLENFDRDFSKIEASHFWYLHRKHAALDFLLHASRGASVPPKSSNTWESILEIGSGSGGMLAEFLKLSNSVYGIEPYPNAFSKLLKLKDKYPQLNLFCEPAQQVLKRFDQKLSLIASFDVFEHIENDLELMQSCYSALKPGGYLILSVPASMALWSTFDEFDSHFRRYSKAGLSELASQVGFKVERVSYLYFCLFPLVWSIRKSRDFLKKDPSEQNKEFEKLPNYIVSIIIKSLLRFEFWISKKVSLPIGTSVILLARKPE